MKKLVQERERAILLRKKGLSYKEIQKQVPVAKSSLSLWLKDLPLTKDEKQVLKKRKDSNISLGRIRSAAQNRKNRQAREQVFLIEAKNYFKKYEDQPLFHSGIALYWAEGAKRSDMFLFMNSDVEMIETMLLWLEKYTEYRRSEIGFRLFLHEPFLHDNWESWWAKNLGVNLDQFKKTIVKPSGFKAKKRPNYKGCLRVEVPRSGRLLITTKFWMNMLVEYYKKR